MWSPRARLQFTGEMIEKINYETTPQIFRMCASSSLQGKELLKEKSLKSLEA